VDVAVSTGFVAGEVAPPAGEEQALKSRTQVSRERTSFFIAITYI
jgi:hypothetical protein